MAFGRRSIGREFGTAFAVLAIYVLTLLLPLHHAAGLQRDLGELGFETVGWSVCAPLAQDADGEPAAPISIKCAAAGIAKQDFAAVLPDMVGIDRPAIALRSGRPHIQHGLATSLPEHVGQSRAPPVAV